MFYVENSRIIPQFLSLKKQLLDNPTPISTLVELSLALERRYVYICNTFEAAGW